MKTLHIIFAAILMIFTMGTINASNDPASNSAVEKIINSRVSYPVLAKEQMVEGTVEILFIIDLNGNLHLIDMESSDKIFEENLKKDLAQIDFKSDDIVRNQIYRIKILYKLL